PAGTERRAIKHALRLSRAGQADTGEALTEAGAPVTRLIFITSGVVQIEKGDKIIAVCGPGDYVGEMSFMTGSPATATARVVKAARFLTFDQVRLRDAIRSDLGLRRVIEAGINRNLV